MGNRDLKNFYEKYWENKEEKILWRHNVAFTMVTPNSNVLDVGCGDGALGSLLIRQKNCRVTGVDLSSEALKRAEKNGLRTLLLDVERETLPFKVNQFDCVIALDVLEHLHSPKDLLKKLLKVTRRSGIFSYGNVSWWRNRARLLIGKVPPYAPFKCGQHLHYWNFYDFRDLLSSCNFIPLRYEVLGGIPLFGRVLPKDIEEGLVRLRPNLFGFGFVWETLVKK